MIVVNIFTTAPMPDMERAFVHGNVKFRFARLEPEMLHALMDGPTFVFIDWSSPNMSGLEMCRRLRANPRTAKAHLTMVLERDEPDDRRRALEAGADDYMPGPIERRRVLDRVLVTFDASVPAATETIICGDLVVDLEAMRARWKGTIIPLAENEFRVLRFLAQHPNKVHTRQDLLLALGKDTPTFSERTADVWMKRLRDGLREVGLSDALRTVWLHGYSLEIPTQGERPPERAEPRGG